jgi:hypothetical protein
MKYPPIMIFLLPIFLVKNDEPYNLFAYAKGITIILCIIFSLFYISNKIVFVLLSINLLEVGICALFKKNYLLSIFSLFLILSIPNNSYDINLYHYELSLFWIFSYTIWLIFFFYYHGMVTSTVLVLFPPLLISLFDIRLYLYSRTISLFIHLALRHGNFYPQGILTMRFKELIEDIIEDLSVL